MLSSMFEDFVPKKAQSSSMEIASEKKAMPQVRTIIYQVGIVNKPLQSVELPDMVI